MTLWSNDVWRVSLKVAGALTLVGSFASLTLVGCESGGVGDPCIPEDEYRENFPGFNLSEENIESRSFQCKTRICLVNHFQGRVTCQAGQESPEACTDTGSCTVAGEECQAGGVILSDCDPTKCGEADDEFNCNDGNGNNQACGGRQCHAEGRYCMCTDNAECPEGYKCCAGDSDPACADAAGLCITKVCAPPERDDASRCYIPGTNDPVAVPVCGWCENRPPEKAVYCSCRCGPPSEGATEADDNFNFCECPEGYSCQEIRKNIGLGDAQIAGAYCVKEGTVFEDEQADCGTVKGNWPVEAACAGLPE
jgi:hypothetical protein